jgi:hypothetical protein
VYDRWQPSLFAVASSDTSFVGPEAFRVHDREIEAGVSMPWRRVRVVHRAQLSLLHASARAEAAAAVASSRHVAGRLAWSTTTARQYGFSISPEDGVALGGTIEHVPHAFGAAGAATTLVTDGRAYLPGLRQHDVLAVRASVGVALGDERTRRAFTLGGASAGAGVVDFGHDALSLLRGFRADSFRGARAATTSVEYRWPLARIERGSGTWPVFVHTLHAAVFADAAHAWNTQFRLTDVKTSIGGELSVRLVAGHWLPLTLTAGGAWGRDGASGADRSQVYVRTGRAF